MGLTYDPKKIKLVNIDEVVPNDWNPKDENTAEYAKVKKSIESIGLEGTIKTRQFEGKNQVVDGMQRYKVAKELGFKEVYIYDEGKLSDQRAREKTIWWQQQVPFNKVEEAYLVLKITEMGEPIELPYTEVELADLKQLASFDFEQYQNEEDFSDDDEGVKTLLIKMQEPQYNIVMEAINKVKAIDNCTDSQAIERICADYLAGV